MSRAYKGVRQELPPDTGIAVVVISHARRAPSLLREILSLHTRIPAQMTTSGMKVEQKSVYVVPPSADLTRDDGNFRLHQLSKPFGRPKVITIFPGSLERGKAHRSQ